jgi:regulator of replication initiation timing
MSGRKDSSARNRALRSDTAERLEAIVEAAERAAENVIDDAEAQARRYLAETRARADREASQRLAPLTEVTETLIEEASALRRRAERLQATLEEAKARIEGDSPGEARDRVPEDGIGKVTRLTRLAAVEQTLPEPAAEDLEPPPRQSPAGARLLATQMAVSGSSREEIERRLRHGFHIEDTAAILDAILGPED